MDTNTVSTKIIMLVALSAITIASFFIMKQDHYPPSSAIYSLGAGMDKHTHLHGQKIISRSQACNQYTPSLKTKLLKEYTDLARNTEFKHNKLCR